MSDVILFVYGTLRPGESQAWRLGDSQPLGPATTTPEYTLIDLGPYPAMAPGGHQAVVGDLVSVSARTLADLDEFEGALYHRAEITLSGRDTRALAYLVTPSFASGRPAVASSDWTTRARRK